MKTVKPRGEAIFNSTIHLQSVYESPMSRLESCNSHDAKRQESSSLISSLEGLLGVMTTMDSLTVVTTCSGMTEVGHCLSVGDRRTHWQLDKVRLSATEGR